jgi:hypothetical protein
MMLKTYREQDGQMILGEVLFAFICNDQYYFTPIAVYADGLIDCWGLVDLDGLMDKLEEGWVVTQVPVGSQAILPLSSPVELVTTTSPSLNQEVEFLKLVADTIERLNGRSTSQDRFSTALDRWRAARSAETEADLLDAYEDIPDWGLERSFATDLLEPDEAQTLFGLRQSEAWLDWDER